MLARILIIAAVLAGIYFLIHRLRRSAGGPQWGRIALAVGAVGFLLLLTFRGGAEIALPLLVAMSPLLLRWLKSRPDFSSTTTGTGSSGQSAVTTRFLDMTLDHANGAMAGRIREGQFAGRALGDLNLPEWLTLWRECQVDPQSVAVLEAYLDRYAEPGWREQQHDAEQRQSSISSAMTRSEAYQVLGLQPDATPAEIQAAYRRLIQRLHPDQGGSAYLAAHLNQARDLLLDS